jgi:hypothetical protein
LLQSINSHGLFVSRTIKKEAPKELSFDTTLRRLQSVALKNRLILDQTFTDFDRLKKGRSGKAFSSVLYLNVFLGD